MEHSKLKSYLEVATNVAILLVAGLLLSSFAVKYFYRDRPAPRLIGGLEKGQQIPQVAGINYGNSAHTLLVAMNTQCGYCTKSIPFYNELAKLEQNSKTPLHIVAAFPNQAEQVRQYVEQHQLKLESKDSIDFAQLKVAGTPTMILVDQSGHVIDFWVGGIPPEDQQKVLAAIASL
jgi:thioredoxin-related protein